VAPQAFSLLNSPQSHDRALAMSRRLEMQATTFESRIEQAFRLALGRAPSKHEAAAAMDHVKRMTAHHRAHPPQRVDPPLFVTREMVEEMTGLTFTWDERLDVYADWTADLKPWDVAAETRALADLCLVLFNSNEFAYVY
jgi:hypothetical protein